MKLDFLNQVSLTPEHCVVIDFTFAHILSQVSLTSVPLSPLGTFCSPFTCDPVGHRDENSSQIKVQIPAVRSFGLDHE